MKIQVRKSTVEEWQDIASRCSYATWFHTPEWYQLWQEYEQYPFDVDAFELPDGRKAIFPYLYARQFYNLTKFRFTPAGTYGGLISADEFSTKETEKLKSQFSRTYDNVRIRQFPLSPFVLPESRGKKEYTFLVYLDKPMPQIMREWRENYRRVALKSERLGLKLQEAQSLEDWEKYFEAYKETFAHWKAPESSYGWDFFEKLARLDSSKVKLWLVTLDEKMLSGAIFFYHKNIVEFWHNSTFDEARELNPNRFLHYSLMKRAQSDGYKIYDLGPSGYKENVAHFKRGFAPELLLSNLYIRAPKWLEAYQNVRKSLGI